MALRGKFTPPGDKSVSHRAILLPILAEGQMTINGLSDCEDVKSSLKVFRALGGQSSGSLASLTIKGLEGRPKIEMTEVLELDCGNSGTTMRLAGGILSGLEGRYMLDGDQQLRRRPMERLADPLRQMGARIETSSGRAPVSIQGNLELHGIDYVNKEGSAQLKGAVMLATLSATSPTSIYEPIPTRDHTESLISAFGGKVTVSDQKIEVFPGRLTLPPDLAIPGDPSSAAFFLVGAAMIPGSRVVARHILLSSSRIGFLKVLNRMGANISIAMEQEKPEPNGHVTVEYNGPLKATEVSKEEIPSLIDEVPILALAAACAQGVTVFRSVQELRVKETDRLTAIKHQLGAMGVRVRVENDDLFVEGPTKVIMPDSLDSGHDHRLAMALYLALEVSGASIPIVGDESISISYPSFREDLRRLTQG